MLHVILLQPEIAPNTGNVGRMCAVTNSRLHLIHPLGFTIDDRHLRRAGMDYWNDLDVREHESFAAFLASADRPAEERIILMTTKADRSLWDCRFADGDGLLFGCETRGVSQTVHQWAAGRRARIPQPNPAMRSLNLATAAGIATYEALRQVCAADSSTAPART